MKKYLAIPFLIFLAACGGGDHKPVEGTNQPQTESATSSTEAAQQKTGDSKGVGKYTSVDLKTPLEAAKADNGQKVYQMKCASCHRLDDKKLVGPGYRGVTERRKPEWIMNFVTNVDENLSKDPQAMAMLEECLVRMPNQNLTDEDARNILEFMRRNDGVK